MSRTYQSANNSQILHIDRPYDLTFIDRVDVVDLHTDIASRMFAGKRMQFDTFEFGHTPLCTGAHRKVHLATGKFSQNLDTGLQVLLLIAQHEVVIGSQWGRIERRHEDGFRRIGRIGDDAVGTLHKHRPQTGVQQQLDQFVAQNRRQVGLGELLKTRLGIGRNGHGKHLALFAAVDGSHRTADRRSEKDALVVLVEEQRRTGFHTIALLHQKFGSNALEIERRKSILRSDRSIGRRCTGLALQIDVETLA